MFGLMFGHVRAFETAGEAEPNRLLRQFDQQRFAAAWRNPCCSRPAKATHIRMRRTGMYGDNRGLALRDFAVGYGPGSVGVPNTPPNRGPTS